MRELRVEDALMYLDQVKMEFGDRPHIYNEFLDIMKTFKSQQIDTPGVIQRVSALFHGNKRLVLGFNTFLPEGYKIELPLDGSGLVVYREPGRAGVTQVTWPGMHQHLAQQQAQQGQSTGPLPPARPAAAFASQQQPQGSQGVGVVRVPPRIPPPSAAVSAMRPSLGTTGGHRTGPVGGPFVAPPGSAYPSGKVGPPPHAMAQLKGPITQPQQQQQQSSITGTQHPTVVSSTFQPTPGQTATGPTQHPVSLAASAPAPTGSQPRPPHLPPATVTSMAIPPSSSVAPPAPSAAPAPQLGQQGPVEFDHAINYVTTIKKRFASNPEIYRKFLEILHTYQKEQRGIKEVLDEVSVLFADHADLLKEFTYFLPDAVQGVAKKQLDEVATIAEERARLKAAGVKIPAISPVIAAAKVRVAARDKAAGRVSVGLPAVATGSVGAGAVASGVGAPASNTTNQTPKESVSLPLGNTASGMVEEQHQRIPTSHVKRVPFGATQGRSENEEMEICKNVVNGTASFDPVRPPRRNELTPSQASHAYGRPRSIPNIPLQSTTLEFGFFEKVQAHFNRKDIFPDAMKPTATRKQPPYAEFIKCIHLFGIGILNKDELIQLLRGLLLQGNSSKSGSTSSAHVSANHSANNLIADLEKIMTRRGPFAAKAEIQKYKSKYGGYPIRELDVSDVSRKITPSYWTYPSEFVFDTFTDQTEKDSRVLNHDCFCMANETTEEVEKLHKSLEEYDGVKKRHNVYQEVLSRMEEEMYEVDMAIERNSVTMHLLEPIADEATKLREQEEKAGQPIGRLQYKLQTRSLNSIHIGAIARIYGDAGDEVVHHLMRNPLVVIPIVYQRMKEKDHEWRNMKEELTKEWKESISENYAGSLDVKCYFLKRELEKSFSEEILIEECQKAELLTNYPTELRFTTTNATEAHSLTNPKMSIYQPYLSVSLSEHMPHKDVFSLLSLQLTVENTLSNFQKDDLIRVWTRFMVPWFGSNFKQQLQSELACSRPTQVLDCPGERVRTTLGDGQILSIERDTEIDDFFFLVKFSFGIGYVHPDAILDNLSSNDTTLLETDGEKYYSTLGHLKVLFGTENIYIFMRLYVYLAGMMLQAKLMIDMTNFIPENSIYRNKFSFENDCEGYSWFVSVMKEVVQGKIDAKTFETVCRDVVGSDAFYLATIPLLVEKCAEALSRVIKENYFEPILHCSQLMLKDLKVLRTLSMGVTDQAVYRIQIDSNTLFFSYLPGDEELVLS